MTSIHFEAQVSADQLLHAVAQLPPPEFERFLAGVKRLPPPQRQRLSRRASTSPATSPKPGFRLRL